MSGADITDPEVIRGFRRRYDRQLQVISTAIAAADGDAARIRDWLQGEQLGHWKRQVRIREEAYQTARLAWMAAESEVQGQFNTRGVAKPSSVEERIAMDKARRRRDEAEEKLGLVRRWLIRLSQECDPLLHRCHDHELALREIGAAGLARLDRLAEDLDRYHGGPACPV